MHWQRKHNCGAVKQYSNLGKKYLLILSGVLNRISLMIFMSFGFKCDYLRERPIGPVSCTIPIFIQQRLQPKPMPIAGLSGIIPTPQYFF